MTVSLLALKARALLLDVEGTTTPIEFVYRVLFPYARAHAAAYLRREGESAACRAAIAQLREERAKESGVAQDAGSGVAQGAGSGVAQGAGSGVAQGAGSGVAQGAGSGVAQGAGSGVAQGAGSGVAQDFSPAEILPYVFALMDRDKKSPGLKALQGLIWQDGYKSGELRGQVYLDVAPAFGRWRASGHDIYIYSSGSVLAQQLLFGSTDAGDLTRFLKGYFDTGVGSKTSPGSYRAISEGVHIAPSEMLFVSDVVQELDAARASGMRTALCVRGTDVPPGSESHQPIRTFDEIVN